MATFTVTITPTAVNSIGAKWCVVGITDWLDTAITTTLATAGKTISFKYVEGYLSPANITITAGMISAGTTAAVYIATQWISSWGPPMCGCLFRGQVLLGGRYYTTEQTFPSSSRIIRWSEIGAFRFLGAGANAQKNEAGYTYTKGSSDECVMSILPLKDAVVVYTTMAVTILKPVEQPAPTYGVDELIVGIGIMNPLAAAGNGRDHQVFVDKSGWLREITINQYGVHETKLIGYNNVFGSMQDNFDISTGAGVVVVTYNADEEEYYISDGLRSFTYNKKGLTEIGVTITSCINLTTSLISKELFNSCQNKFLGGVTNIGENYIYLETDVMDFSLAGMKTIQQIEVGGSYGANASIYTMVKWRNNKSSLFIESPWRRCSPNGVSTNIVSGVDFKVCIMVSAIEGTILNNMTIEWKLIDKSSVRGNYASGTPA